MLDEYRNRKYGTMTQSPWSGFQHIPGNDATYTEPTPLLPISTANLLHLQIIHLEKLETYLLPWIFSMDKNTANRANPSQGGCQKVIYSLGLRIAEGSVISFYPTPGAKFRIPIAGWIKPLFGSFYGMSLQHPWPKGFVNIHYFGSLDTSKGRTLNFVKELLVKEVCYADFFFSQRNPKNLWPVSIADGFRYLSARFPDKWSLNVHLRTSRDCQKTIDY